MNYDGDDDETWVEGWCTYNLLKIKAEKGIDFIVQILI